MPEILWLLVAVVLVMGLAYLVTRFLAGHQTMLSRPGRDAKMLHIVEQIYMGRDKQVVLVQAGDRYFLLGSTQAQINTLAELSPEEVEEWRRRQPGEDGQAPNFARSLQEIIKQRSRRDSGD